MHKDLSYNAEVLKRQLVKMKKTMLAAVFEGQEKLSIKEVLVPEIEKEDDVIIKVIATGICGTDLHILYDNSTPFVRPDSILGHEMVGEAVKTGKMVKNVSPGDRVVIDPNEYCGYCDCCRMNLFSLCTNKKQIFGTFSEFTKASSKIVFKISDNVEPETACLVEPLANVINGAVKLKIQPWESVFIFGGGPIGLMFSKFLDIQGALKILISETSKYRRRFAEGFGADIILDPLNDSYPDIMESIKKTGVAAVIDTVGLFCNEGIKMVRKGGRILLFSTYNMNCEIPQFDITFKEISLLGSLGPGSYFLQAIKLLEAKPEEFSALVTHVYKLENILEGFDVLKTQQAMKVIIKP